MKEFAPDVAHTWLVAANSFGRVAARMAGVPRIMASERCVDPWKTSTHLMIDRRLSRFTETITTNTEAVRDFYAGRGIDANLFRIIPNGIPDRTKSTIDRDEAFRRLEVSPDRKLILAVGRLWPQKRYRDLIWAAEMLATMRQDISFVIIGDGPQQGELLRHRDAVSTPKHVRFAGARDDVADLMPHADVFWIGSEYEGQSNSLIEAMQASVPVVASDIPGNRDLVIPGQTGRLSPLGDRADFARQTHLLLEHPEESSQMADRARQRIESDFTVEAMVNSHAELYRNPR